MTSLSFDSNTLNQMMNLVDENSENISEKSYLQMCNALKFLHNSQNTAPVLQYISNRLDFLNDKLRNIKVEMLNMEKPRLNNRLKHYANAVIGTKYNIITEKSRVVILTGLTEDTLRVIISPTLWFEDNDTSINIDLLENNPSSRCVKNCQLFILKHISKKKLYSEYADFQLKRLEEMKTDFVKKNAKELLDERDKILQLKTSICGF